MKKIIREGSCQQCGACCKGVTIKLYTDKDHPEAQKRVESYMKWLDMHRVAYNVFPDGIEIVCGGACDLLAYSGGKAKCLDYDNRPIVCKEFPRDVNAICVGFTFREEVDGKGQEVKSK